MAGIMEQLSMLDAVSGCEDAARELIKPLIKNKCDNIEVDSMGNIVAFKSGEKHDHKILVGTNIDEVGFIVSDITDSGFVRFKTVGEIDPRTLVSKTVHIGKNRVLGVIGMKAIHLQKKEEREATVKVKDLYIDIGHTSKKSAEKVVSLGDRISFNTEFADLGNCIKGKALDRFGTLVLLDALNETPQYDTYFVFACQREVPASIMGRGLRIASHRINPDFAFIVNTVNSGDFCNSKSISAKLGMGTVIEYMDKTSVRDVSFTEAVKNLAEKNNIMYQEKTSSYGYSMNGAVQTASTGTSVASVAIPCRYSHTPVSYMNKNDIDETIKLLKAFVRESGEVIDGITKKTN